MCVCYHMDWYVCVCVWNTLCTQKSGRTHFMVLPSSAMTKLDGTTRGQATCRRFMTTKGHTLLAPGERASQFDTDWGRTRSVNKSI